MQRNEWERVCKRERRKKFKIMRLVHFANSTSNMCSVFILELISYKTIQNNIMIKAFHLKSFCLLIELENKDFFLLLDVIFWGEFLFFFLIVSSRELTYSIFSRVFAAWAYFRMSVCNIKSSVVCLPTFSIDLGCFKVEIICECWVLIKCCHVKVSFL